MPGPQICSDPVCTREDRAGGNNKIAILPNPVQFCQHLFSSLASSGIFSFWLSVLWSFSALTFCRVGGSILLWPSSGHRSRDDTARGNNRMQPILCSRLLANTSFLLFLLRHLFFLGFLSTFIDLRIYNKLRCICDCLSSMGKWIC